jgi:hypothetical protein
MTDKTPVAQVVHALSHDRRTEAYEQGGRYSANRLEAVAIASDAAKTLGTDPTFDQWSEYAVQWKDGYMHNNPDNTGGAADTAWGRFASTLNELFGLTKPKSTGKAATAKATAREAKAAEVLAKHADKAAHTIKEQIAKNYSAIAEAVKQGKSTKVQRDDGVVVDLKKELKELETVLKVKTSEENKAFGEELKALRAEVREAVGKCTDLEQLQAALDVLSGGFDINYDIS